MLENVVWIKNARHSNSMDRLLERELRAISGVRVLFPVESNAVFVEVPAEVADALRNRGWLFYNFIGVGGVRLMCSWDTTEEDVKALAADLRGVST
jgi:threonine aldolase